MWGQHLDNFTDCVPICAPLRMDERRHMSKSIKQTSITNIRQRKDGRWEGRYRYAGKQKSVYGKTRKEVRDKLSEIQAEMANNEFVEETDLIVEKWMGEWMSQNHRLKDSTRRRYERDIRLHIVPYIGKTRLKDLTPLMVQRLYDRGMADGLSPKSVYNIHGILHEALDKAVRLDLLRRNVSEKVDLPKQRKSEMHPLTDGDVQKFLDVSRGSRYHDMFVVDIFTGLRESELIGLTWDCISFERKEIRVYRQLNRNGSDENGVGIYQFYSLKNDRERIVPAPDAVLNIFRRQKKRQMEWRLRAGSLWSNKHDLVFTNELGKHVIYQSLYKALKGMVQKIGRPEVRVHDLRHTYATLSLQHGVDVKTLSTALGHATAAFTLDRYGHVSQGMRQDMADKLDAAMSQLAL